MKILPNIIPLIKIKNSLKRPDKYKKDIEKYRLAEDTEKERKFILQATSEWGKDILDIFSIDLTVNGRENLPTEGPVLYASNHQGYGDIPVCCAVLDTIQFGFIAKEELLNAGFKLMFTCNEGVSKVYKNKPESLMLVQLCAR